MSVTPYRVLVSLGSTSSLQHVKFKEKKAIKKVELVIGNLLSQIAHEPILKDS